MASRDGSRREGGQLESERCAAYRVADKTVGIIGYGRIGKATARKLRGFGCRVLANSPSLLREHGVGAAIDGGVLVADLETIQRERTPSCCMRR